MSRDYKIQIKGEFIAGNVTFKDLDILDDDFVIIEIKGSSFGWNFFNDEIKKDEKCECCMKYTSLKFICSCKKVGYCSQIC